MIIVKFGLTFLFLGIVAYAIACVTVWTDDRVDPSKKEIAIAGIGIVMMFLGLILSGLGLIWGV